MINFKFLLTLTFVLIANAAHAGNLVTCELRSQNNKTVSATIDLNKSLANGVDSSGGLDVGKDNYSFGMAIEKGPSFYELVVIFYENNNVQDEVGGLTCKFVPQKKPSIICKETLHDEEKVVARLSCVNH